MYINSLDINNIPGFSFILNYLNGLVYPYEIFKTLMDIVTGNTNIYQILWFIVEIVVLSHFFIRYSKEIEEERKKFGDIPFSEAVYLIFYTQLSDKVFLFVSIWSYIMGGVMILFGNGALFIMAFNLGLGTLTMGLLYAIIDFASLKWGSLSNFSVTHLIFDEFIELAEEEFLGLVFFTVAGAMLLAFGYKNIDMLILGAVFVGLSLPFLILASRKIGEFYILSSDLSVVFAKIKKGLVEVSKEHPEISRDVILLHAYIGEARIAYEGYYQLNQSIKGIKRGEKILETIGMKDFHVFYDEKSKEIHVGVLDLIDLTTKNPAELKNKIDEVISFLEELIAEKTGEQYVPIEDIDDEKTYYSNVAYELEEKDEENKNEEEENTMSLEKHEGNFASNRRVIGRVSDDEANSMPESDEQSHSERAYDKGIKNANRRVVGYMPDDMPEEEEKDEEPAFEDEEEKEKKRATRKHASNRKSNPGPNFN